jgi:methionine-rich copper-binding protein CopC
MRKLATPVPSTDGDITEEVSKVTWRPTSKAGWILPGQFEEFGLSMRIPNKPGSTLYFPARQTYSNGEVVNWTGAAGSESPAPALTVTAPVVATAAHTPLKSVSPKRNSTRRSVTEVRATFKARMQTGVIEITKGGATVPLKSSGLLSSNKAVVRAVPKAKLSPGSYTVNWRARAGDGHSEKGSWKFKVSG